MTSGTDVAHGEAHQGTTTLHQCMNILDSLLLYLSAKTWARLAKDPVNLILNFRDAVITLLKKRVNMHTGLMRCWLAKKKKSPGGFDAF